MQCCPLSELEEKSVSEGTRVAFAAWGEVWVQEHQEADLKIAEFA